MKIFFGKREVEARPGDTIAAALYRSGQRIFSRSFKYHRPRGLVCAAGKCPNCMMNVDGVPNVRTCITPATAGVQVKGQNAFPSLEHDGLSATQYLDRLMPVGWYYKIFTSRTAWHAVEPFIRRMAGLGEPPAVAAGEYEHGWLHCDVAIVGAGYAGMTAALEASERGSKVTLIDDQSEPGGQLLYRKRSRSGADGLIERLKARSEIRVLQGSYCFGLYEGNLLGVVQPAQRPGTVERLLHVRAGHVVVATGAYETPLVFPNNDLPGVMLATAAQRLMHLFGLQPGRRAVIIGADEDRVGELRDDFREKGTEVVAVVSNEDVVGATGGSEVTGLRCRNRKFSCDLIVVCGPRVPDAGLIAQAGGKLEWNQLQGAFVPTALPHNVSVVGDAAGETISAAFSPPAAGKRSFVCFCSDVSSKDLCDGVAEGFDHIETLKRYTTSTMGPCQGRMCQLMTIGICAQETGRSIADTGVTTSRPPNPSVTLGALAGNSHHPIRRTPLHDAHEELGAVWLDMGDWKRPRYYRTAPATPEKESVQGEYWAVRERAGLIDVSTLGKLDVRGSDAGRLLDKVYTHHFSDLRPGRARYALMCDEAGVILDDGTISRLSDDRYFVTTTTGNLDFVYQWLEWHLAETSWDVRVTNVTGGFGAMNIAGPKARDVLKKLTDCDLSPTAFPYMACRQAEVSGARSLLLRVGFVGETGWEVHCPAEAAEFVWGELLEAGREFGIRPFGIEAQRLLRLEKRHLIVGVDTDALSTPYEADMGWAVKLDKQDFTGKAALAKFASAPPRERLVGFALRGTNVPEDGCAVVVDGKLAGRVTSSRYSPVKQMAIGLAWVRPEKAREGASIGIRQSGRLVPASVTLRPFYDPEGTRLRT